MIIQDMSVPALHKTAVKGGGMHRNLPPWQFVEVRQIVTTSSKTMAIVFHGGGTEHRSVSLKQVSPSQGQFDRNSVSKTLEKSPCYQSCTTPATADLPTSAQVKFMNGADTGSRRRT